MSYSISYFPFDAIVGDFLPTLPSIWDEIDIRRSYVPDNVLDWVLMNDKFDRIAFLLWKGDRSNFARNVDIIEQLVSF